MPPDQVIGDDAIDEQRKFIAVLPLSPASLPVPDHGLDLLFFLSGIAAVRLRHGRQDKRGGGELLRFVDPSGDLDLNPAGRFDRNFLEVGSDGFAESAAFLKVGEDKGERER